MVDAVVVVAVHRAVVDKGSTLFFKTLRVISR
jgi:hypothetical protein